MKESLIWLARWWLCAWKEMALGAKSSRVDHSFM